MFSFSKSVRLYGLSGALFGCCFPAAALVIDRFWLHTEPVAPGALILANPLHFIILLAPIVLGAVFAFLGAERDRSVKTAERRHAQDHEYRLIVEGITDYAIYMLDKAGHVRTWNAGAARFKGYAADEVIGKHFSMFFGADDRESGLAETALSTALAEGSFEAEGWRYRKDGTSFWAQVLIDPIYSAEGKHVGFAKITRDRTEQKRAADRIQHMAGHDPLTGLANRALLVEQLDELLAASDTMNDQRVAVINIDLNRFKEINDTHGHTTGDRLLQITADRMREIAGQGGCFARFGGDEFVGYIPFATDDELREFLSALTGRLNDRAILDETELLPQASIGVSLYPEDGQTSERLISNADLAMYRAKHAIESQPCFFEQSMDDAARERRILAQDMRLALDHEEFYLHFQEQRSVKFGDVVGYEALLRWDHPSKGRISPAIFIPIAEESGLIFELGAWVLRKACEEATKWEIGEKIAINVSPVQLTNVALVEVVKQALIATGLSPSRLELEVTETAIIADKRRALHVLRQLRALGVTIAIDDFGTGYSSLDTLRSFNFDRIKVDRSFVVELAKDDRSRSMLRAILALGKSLKVSVLVEGVETDEQLAILTSEGCDEIQGFLYGLPATFDELRRSVSPANPAAEIRVS